MPELPAFIPHDVRFCAHAPHYHFRKHRMTGFFVDSPAAPLVDPSADLPAGSPADLLANSSADLLADSSADLPANPPADLPADSPKRHPHVFCHIARCVFPGGLLSLPHVSDRDVPGIAGHRNDTSHPHSAAYPLPACHHDRKLLPLPFLPGTPDRNLFP